MEHKNVKAERGAALQDSPGSLLTVLVMPMAWLCAEQQFAKRDTGPCQKKSFFAARVQPKQELVSPDQQPEAWAPPGFWKSWVSLSSSVGLSQGPEPWH